MDTPILQIDSLTKHFRSHWTFRPVLAVKDVSLSVQEGEAFGFLGHNGAGKTTTMKCIVGLVSKTSGKILIDGGDHSDPTRRKILGYLPELPYFYDHLTVEETLDFFGHLYGIPSGDRKKQVGEALERVGMSERRKSSIRALSKGLQQRVGFAQAILNKPRLLLLDEPFSGLDPLGRLEFRNLILDLRRNGTTIFLSSHILSDVQDICDRVAIMARGDLKTTFHLKDAAKLYGETFEMVLVETQDTVNIIRQLAQHATSASVTDSLSERLHTLAFQNYAAAEAAFGQAAASRIRIQSFATKSLSLEEIFMNVTRESTTANGHDQRALPHALS